MGRFLCLISLFVLAVLSGCASSTYTTVKAYPPVDLVQDCNVTPYGVETNADLARAITSLKGAMQLCNNDKKALRLWMEDDK